MFALVDCNNFYVGCERLFKPQLGVRPVVVLSNNDGCVIARSDEAKALGIVMGTPAYLSEALFKEHGVVKFSSNYTLYGDMSDRVMKILKGFVPRLELYSIDEAFLDMTGMVQPDLHLFAGTIRSTVTSNTGLPVSVGIAPTKTLAKMANHYAKKRAKDTGVFCAVTAQQIDEMLAYADLEDVWGIGHEYALLLKRNGFKKAKDIVSIPADWMRSKMSVVGLRLWHELQGIPSKEWEFEPKAKKNICTSRSFYKLTNDVGIIREALSNHAATCALKLRRQASVCRYVKVSVSTNPHKIAMKQLQHSVKLQCETATNLDSEIIPYALKGLDLIYDPGFLFMKCGVEVLDVIPESEIQVNMFDTKNRNRDKKLFAAMDALNRQYGRSKLRMAVQRFDNRYHLKADFLSQRYTTRLDEVLTIKI